MDEKNYTLKEVADYFRVEVSTAADYAGAIPMTTRSRRPLPNLPPDLQQHRCIDKIEVAALMGISPKYVDQGVYGDPKRGIAPWGSPSFTIGRRRVWRLKDVVKWIDAQVKAQR